MGYAPAFRVSPRLADFIERIAALRERVHGAAFQVAWIPALQKDARVRNTHSSTAIEGNPLTLDEVRAVEQGRPPPEASVRSRREVLNYFAALRYVERRQRARAIRERDVLKLHAIIGGGAMDQGTPGAYRRVRVWVGRHTPPDPRRVPRLMADLLEWWNGASSAWSPVITSAVLHHRFEDIHPFEDGNGRTGRALALWELYRRGFDTHHIFSVDEYYWDDRDRYYKALDAPRRAGGDLTPWLEYAAEGIHDTLERVWLRIRRLGARPRAARLTLTPKQEKLLRLLRDRGALSPREIWKFLGVSRQGAMNLLRPLLAAGLVRKIGTKKSGRYVLA